MLLTPPLRKLALTAHVTCSVGWLGAVVCSLALALAGVLSPDAQLVRASYLALEVVAWMVLVPLSVASLVTGVVQSLGTRWGVFRHYWVVMKLVMNLVAVVVLLLYTQTLGYLADIAGSLAPPAGSSELRSPSPVLHSALAVVLLLFATVLALYKPKGVTRYGRRKQRALSQS
jgi:hypothetical protein